MRGRQSWFRAGQRLWQSIRPVQPSRGAGPSPRAERVLPAHSKEIRRSRGASIVGACRSYQRADVSSPFKSGDPATAGCTLYASCGSGGRPACRRAGRPARRKSAPRPGKVELFASPVETRALDQAARLPTRSGWGRGAIRQHHLQNRPATSFTVARLWHGMKTKQLRSA
jgi:hypothetical protein